MEHGMHHPATDKGAESDLTTTTPPMHHGGDSGPPHTGAGAHIHDLEDFKKRFIISTIITIPILLLSPVIQSFLGLQYFLPRAEVVTPGLASNVYF